MDKTEKRRRFLINLLYWAAILALVYLVFKYLFRLLMPFVIAFAVAWILRPLCRLYKARTRFSTALTVATVVFFYLVIGGLVMILLINIGGEISEYVSRLPNLYTQTLEPGLKDLYLRSELFISRFDPTLENVVGDIISQVISSLGSAVTSFSMSAVAKLTTMAGKLPGTLLSGAIAIIATIFMATSYDRIRRFLNANLPEKILEFAGYVGKSFKNIIVKYGFSYLEIMLLTFGEIALGLFIIRVSRPVLAALLIAVFDIFPIVGAGLILLPWTIILFIQGQTLQGIGMGALYIIVIVVREIVEPKIVGKQVGLPPLVTLACMFIGTSLFGGIGLFGLPILAAILVNLDSDPEVPVSIFRAPEEEEAYAGRRQTRRAKRKKQDKN